MRKVQTGIIKLDGVRLKLKAPDVDGDGMTGGVENVTARMQSGERDIVQPTEMGETLRELNSDVIEPGTRMSGIDLRARLHHAEIGPVLAIDTLVALKVLPSSCLAFTRQKKRLSVSLGGEGRKEIVDLVRSKKEQDAKASGGFMDKAKGMLGMGG